VGGAFFYTRPPPPPARAGGPARARAAGLNRDDVQALVAAVVDEEFAARPQGEAGTEEGNR
ncbi:hypothetical protein ACFV0G_38605, partial [Kitasatospora sp. NPDC059571]